MIVNTVNGMKYVGQTVYTAKHRWSQHKSSARNGSKYKLQTAIRQFGEDTFELVILATNVEYDALNHNEEFYIRKYDTVVTGYNICTAGTGGRKSEFSKEHRKALSEALKLRHAKSSKEEKLKQAELMNEARKKRGCSEDTKAKYRKRMKGNTYKKDAAMKKLIQTFTRQIEGANSLN